VLIERQNQLDALIESVVGEGVEAIAREREPSKAGRQVFDPDDPNRVQVKWRCRRLGEQDQSSSS
jgi:hypothetical protein